MKVLIAVEAISTCGEAVRAAAARPWPLGSSFCLLNVTDPPYPFVRAPLLLERTRTKMLENLDRAAACLTDAGWSTTTDIVLGSPRRSINQFAKDWQADLVMVGSHGLSDAARLFLGSTAQSVLRHAPCSVEIVRSHRGNGGSSFKGTMKILVATDGSAFSTAALRSVANRPWPAGSIVKVISVPEFILLKDFSYLETNEIQEFGDLGAASMEDAKRCVGAGVEILPKSALNVCSEVPEFEDRPYKVILHEAESWQADMIVLGSHGRTGFDRFIMGSVAEAVALHATCSVEIVRERGMEVKRTR